MHAVFGPCFCMYDFLMSQLMYVYYHSNKPSGITSMTLSKYSSNFLYLPTFFSNKDNLKKKKKKIKKKKKKKKRKKKKKNQNS